MHHSGGTICEPVDVPALLSRGMGLKETLPIARWRVLPVDISEFEKLEACVTCLSVLIPDRS